MMSSFYYFCFIVCLCCPVDSGFFTFTVLRIPQICISLSLVLVFGLCFGLESLNPLLTRKVYSKKPFHMWWGGYVFDSEIKLCGSVYITDELVCSH